MSAPALIDGSSGCPSGWRPWLETTESWPLALRQSVAPWWFLALLSLGLSTVFALVLVVARTPFLGLGAEVFHTALVLHVDLAVVVWFLSVAAGFWMLAAPVSCCVLLRLSRLGLWLAAGGVATVLLTPLHGGANPILANYVPVLDNPMFFFGLIVFMSGVCLAGTAALAGFASQVSKMPGAGQHTDLWRWAIAGAILAFGVAVTVFLLALGGDKEVSVDGRLWGGGHVLQIVHTLMLMAAWLFLGADTLKRLEVPPVYLIALVVIQASTSLLDLGVALSLPIDSAGYRRGFTEVMRWATWPAPLGLAALLLIGYRRAARADGLSRSDACVLASIGLFILGCLVGGSIRGESTAIPAHYHGTVGAVTLAYMAWGRHWLGRFGLSVTDSWPWRAQPFVYGAGIALMVLGLALAGWLGVPRKSPHAAMMVADGAYQFTMGLAGMGGLLATAGAAIFVLWILLAVWQQRNG